MHPDYAAWLDVCVYTDVHAEYTAVCNSIAATIIYIYCPFA